MRKERQRDILASTTSNQTASTPRSQRRTACGIEGSSSISTFHSLDQNVKPLLLNMSFNIPSSFSNVEGPAKQRTQELKLAISTRRGAGRAEMAGSSLRTCVLAEAE